MSPVATPFTEPSSLNRISAAGKAGEDLDPELLGLPGQPAAEIAEAQRVGALVAHERRHQHVRASPICRFSVSTQWWFSVTGTVSGAPLSFQSGISSSSALGSITAPDRMCAPTSLPFSRMQTESSRPASSASCFRRIAALQARRAGADDHHVIGHGFALAHPLPLRRCRAPSHHTIRLDLPCQFLDRAVNGGEE